MSLSRFWKEAGATPLDDYAFNIENDWINAEQEFLDAKAKVYAARRQRVRLWSSLAQTSRVDLIEAGLKSAERRLAPSGWMALVLIRERYVRVSSGPWVRTPIDPPIELLVRLAEAEWLFQAASLDDDEDEYASARWILKKVVNHPKLAAERPDVAIIARATYEALDVQIPMTLEELAEDDFPPSELRPSDLAQESSPENLLWALPGFEHQGMILDVAQIAVLTQAIRGLNDPLEMTEVWEQATKGRRAFHDQGWAEFVEAVEGNTMTPHWVREALHDFD